MPKKGYKQTNEHKEKTIGNLVIGGHRGYKHSKETKIKMSKNNAHNRYWLGKKRPELSNEKHPLWKGDRASYRAKHIWIQDHYGTPTTCEHCQTGNLVGHKIHWANISGQFLRNRMDWLRLCVKCHKLFDKIQKH